MTTFNRPLHILHLPAWYKTPEQPVLGSFFEEQIRALMKSGIKCGVLYPNYVASFANRFRNGPTFNSTEAFDDGGLYTVRVNHHPILPALRFSRTNLAYFRRQVLTAFEKYAARQGKPDMLHAHGVYMGGIAAEMIRQKHGIEYLNTEQFTGILIGELPNHPVFGPWLRTVFREASKTVVCSAAFKSELQAKFGFPDERFVIIPNMVRDEFFKSDLPVNRRESNDPFRLLNVAYLHPKKNQKLLLLAMQLLRRDGFDFRLRIVGDGALEADLRRQIDELGLQDRVELLGRRSREEVVHEVEWCDAVVLTSIVETFGICLIEALANGKPIVATDSIGPRDIVNEENGILVSQGDPAAFADAVRSLESNYSKYDARRIALEAREKYSMSVVAGQLQNMYEEVVGSIH